MNDFRLISMNIIILFIKYLILDACCSIKYRRTSRKKFAGNRVLPKFCDVCSSFGFLELYGYEKKICLKFKVKTKKWSLHKICV